VTVKQFWIFIGGSSQRVFANLNQFVANRNQAAAIHDAPGNTSGVTKRNDNGQ